VEETIELRKRRGWLNRLLPDRGLLRRLRAAGFDEVFLAHRSFRTGLFAWSTRAPSRRGFAGSPSRWACTETVDYATDRHVSERLLSLAGLTDEQERRALSTPWYVTAQASRRSSRKLLADHGVEPERSFVTLAPGSVWPTKRWPSPGFASLARRISERGRVVVLLGTEAERELCAGVCREVAGHAVNLAGLASLSELAAILERAVVHVGNDSGPGHLAAAVDTPVIAIFGPTDPAAGFRPWGEHVLTVGLDGVLDCRPCSLHGSRRCPLDHHRCMRELAPSDVIERIDVWPLSPLSPDTPPAPRGGPPSPAPARRC
jgi:heptosyltransferase-2